MGDRDLNSKLIDQSKDIDDLSFAIENFIREAQELVDGIPSDDEYDKEVNGAMKSEEAAAKFYNEFCPIYEYAIERYEYIIKELKSLYLYTDQQHASAVQNASINNRNSKENSNSLSNYNSTKHYVDKKYAGNTTRNINVQQLTQVPSVEYLNTIQNRLHFHMNTEHMNVEYVSTVHNHLHSYMNNEYTRSEIMTYENYPQSAEYIDISQLPGLPGFEHLNTVQNFSHSHIYNEHTESELFANINYQQEVPPENIDISQLPGIRGFEHLNTVQNFQRFNMYTEHTESEHRSYQQEVPEENIDINQQIEIATFDQFNALQNCQQFCMYDEHTKEELLSKRNDQLGVPELKFTSEDVLGTCNNNDKLVEDAFLSCISTKQEETSCESSVQAKVDTNNNNKKTIKQTFLTTGNNQNVPTVEGMGKIKNCESSEAESCDIYINTCFGNNPEVDATLDEANVI